MRRVRTTSDGHSFYEPSPEEIEEECRKIRELWPPQRFRQRNVNHCMDYKKEQAESWTPPVVKCPVLDITWFEEDSSL